MNHNAAQYHPESCGGLDNMCCECQLAAEREKSAGLTKRAEDAEGLVELIENVCRVQLETERYKAERDTALAAQRAAEERASKTDKALVRAHCDLRWYEGYSGKGSVALAENSTVGFSVAWEKAVVFAPQAPAASPVKEKP